MSQDSSSTDATESPPTKPTGFRSSKSLPTKSNVNKKAQSKQRRAPPARLSWPAPGLSQSTLSFSTATNARGSSSGRSASSKPAKSSPRKRVRLSSSAGPSSSSSSSPPNDQHEHVLWVDKHTPRSSADLCVAPKKVKEIKEWLEEGQKKLLVLVGSAGTGKSTAIHVLAQELHRSVLSWNESIQPRTSSTLPVGGGSPGRRRRQLFSVEQTTSLESFHEFLQQSGSGISTLQLTSLNSNSSTSTSKSDARAISNNSNNIYVNLGSIILLEDLPNLHGADMEARFRTIMTRHLQRSQIPTVLIFSDVAEGKHRPEDLERLIDPDILYDQDQATICQIHAVTKPKMKKVLAAIAKSERCPSQFGTVFFEYLHQQSRGDMRHAIMTFQLQATGSSQPGTIINTNINNTTDPNDRDTKLSTFHSLGKLLYAKRTMVDGASRLAFDPDAIMERSDFGVDGSLRFLEGHAIDFFTDVTDLSEAFRFFSDASTMWNTDLGNGYGGGGRNRRGEDSHSGSVFPFGCAAAVAGRAIANANRHPTPNKFRQFSTPQAFEVVRKRNQNQVMVDQLERRLASSSSSIAPGSLGGTATFVTESLPFLRKIVPELVDPSVNNLYSVARAAHYDRKQQREQLSRQQDDEAEAARKEQEELLNMDDIEEYDD